MIVRLSQNTIIVTINIFTLKMMSNLKIVIDGKGKPRHLLAEELEGCLSVLGEKEETWRNSHVETVSSLSQNAKDELQQRMPDIPENVWFADMQPVAGPVLGPFDTHAEALQAEVTYLEENNLPLGRSIQDAERTRAK
mgnify:CR=1 FL=1